MKDPNDMKLTRWFSREKSVEAGMVGALLLALLLAVLAGAWLLSSYDTHTGVFPERRLVAIEQGQSLMGRYAVVQDTRTGVLYLQTHNGVCVMLDADGLPLIERAPKSSEKNRAERLSPSRRR